jgi:hypothetical protein
MEYGMTIESIVKRCSFIKLFRVLYFRCFTQTIYMDIEWFDSDVARRALKGLKSSKEGGVGLCIEKGIYIDVKIFQEDIANEIDDYLEKKHLKSSKELLNDWLYVYEDLALYEHLSRGDQCFYIDHRNVGQVEAEFFHV